MVSMGQLASWCAAQVLQEMPHRLITELCIDSRKVLFPEQSLFIALKTSRRDGQQFLAEVYRKGVRNFLLHSSMDITAYPDANILLVPDTLKALQQIAVGYRKQFSLPVVGITGSNGKTIVKEWLYQLLSPDVRIIRSPKSYNSQIGVALSVWKLEKDTELALFEAGISQPNEMQSLEQMIQPQQGIITNIGDAHNEGFVSGIEKIKEKLQLFIHCKQVFYCKDYKDIHDALIQSNEQYPARELISWSLHEPAHLQITESQKQNKSTRLKGIYHQEEVWVDIPYTDPAYVEDAIHCWLYLLHSGFNQAIIQDRMMQLHPVAMRLEMKQGINNCTLINDTYNSDLTSLRIALDFLQQQKHHQKHTVVLSDLLQHGRPEALLYEEVAALVAQNKVQRFIGVGPSLYRYKDFFQRIPQLRANFFKSTEDLLRLLPGYEPHNEVILLKGARSFHFEKISQQLEEKIHQTVLSIDMAALLNNLNVYKQHLPSGVKLMVMVKAFSYGSGSYEIGQALQYAGVDYLTVAYTDEGVDLRRSGINVPVMVMSPEFSSFERLIHWKLEPEIYNQTILEQFIAVAKRLNIKDYPVHIKLDTGMHRLGFEQKDMAALLHTLHQTDAVKVQSMFSHLAASEDRTLNYFTEEQHQRFETMTQQLIAELGYTPLRHISNSAGIIAHPELHYDMVRLGIGLHGIDNSGQLQQQLQAVGTLKTTIAQIKEIAVGETVGYGRKGTIDKPTKVATISIGYADGYPRNLSRGKGKVWIKGKWAPIVGVVCMDMCMIDITEVTDAQVGDEVILFGQKPTITEVAEWADTIPYEIMTGISQRVKRVYENEV